MTDEHNNQEQLLDLLVQRTLEGLDDAGHRELDALLRAHPEVNPDQFDEVVAMLDAAPVGDTPPMPAHLSARVMREVDAASTVPDAPRDRFAWWLAAAATVLAVSGWWSVFVNPPRVDTAPPRVAETPPLTDIVDADVAAQILTWQPTEDPTAAAVTGDVHWSPSGQRGYMRFVNLPINDPTVEQYQLWIFDGTRDDAHPVDGGLFDIASTGEVVVPISAKLEVREATLFAVTVEPPGGVVVSSRERLILLAQAP